MRTFISVLCAALTVLSFAACDESDAGLIGEHVYQVRLSNADSQPVHIVSYSDSYGPSNRIDPGSSKTFTDANTEIPFRAGRNGTTIATVTCRLSNPDVFPSEKVSG